MTDTLTLAQQLNGVPMQFTGANVADAIAGFAREYGITHIVLGRSVRSWFARLFGPGVLDGVLRAVPEAHVIVVPQS